MDFVWSRLAVGPDGKVYAGPERNAYLINVYAPTAAIEKTITRPTLLRRANDNQNKMARQIIEAVGANYPHPPQEITIEDTEPVLSNLIVTDDGRIWTQTSDGQPEHARRHLGGHGCLLPEGNFEKQVALSGEHDPNRDAINILPSGRVIVVVGALDAWLNQQGTTGKEEEAQEGDPLEVICYQLDVVVIVLVYSSLAYAT